MLAGVSVKEERARIQRDIASLEKQRTALLKVHPSAYEDVPAVAERASGLW